MIRHTPTHAGRLIGSARATSGLGPVLINMKNILDHSPFLGSRVRVALAPGGGPGDILYRDRYSFRPGFCILTLIPPT